MHGGRPKKVVVFHDFNDFFLICKSFDTNLRAYVDAIFVLGWETDLTLSKNEKNH